MSDNDYLYRVLDAQTLGASSDELKKLREQRQAVESLLVDHFAACSPTIRYGGSKAKGTMILESYDLDMICYFEHEDTAAGATLEEIYNNVETALANDYLVIRKPSALRLKSKATAEYGVDFHIDVVPGRYTDDTCKDTFLYQASGDKKRLKTNLDVHLDHVKGSGVIDAIRLMKLWRVRNALPIKIFGLELMSIELLKNKKTAELTAQLTHVWTELRDNIDNVRIEDPANPTGNDLSELLNEGIRANLSTVAASTLRLIEDYGWEKVFGPVEDADDGDGGSKAESLKRLAASVATPTKPWSQR